MRAPKILIAVFLAGALLWSEPSAAGLDEAYTDGWHSWYVEAADGEQVQFHVLIENGRPERIRSMNWNCRKPTEDAVTDHGTVAAAESFAWFRAVVENSAVDKHVRDAAMFGLVESGGDDAIEYIDGILSRR